MPQSVPALLDAWEASGVSKLNHGPFSPSLSDSPRELPFTIATSPHLTWAYLLPA